MIEVFLLKIFLLLAHIVPHLGKDFGKCGTFSIAQFKRERFKLFLPIVFYAIVFAYPNRY